MKKAIREEVKRILGIHQSANGKLNCQKCNYHNQRKICQIHLVKTGIKDSCNSFKPSRRHSFVSGGLASPK